MRTCGKRADGWLPPGRSTSSFRPSAQGPPAESAEASDDAPPDAPPEKAALRLLPKTIRSRPQEAIFGLRRRPPPPRRPERSFAASAEADPRRCSRGEPSASRARTSFLPRARVCPRASFTRDGSPQRELGALLALEPPGARSPRVRRRPQRACLVPRAVRRRRSRRRVRPHDIRNLASANASGRWPQRERRALSTTSSRSAPARALGGFEGARARRELSLERSKSPPWRPGGGGEGRKQAASHPGTIGFGLGARWSSSMREPQQVVIGRRSSGRDAFRARRRTAAAAAPEKVEEPAKAEPRALRRPQSRLFELVSLDSSSTCLLVRLPLTATTSAKPSSSDTSMTSTSSTMSPRRTKTSVRCSIARLRPLPRRWPRLGEPPDT